MNEVDKYKANSEAGTLSFGSQMRVVDYFERLDGNGSYKKAMELGLNDALLYLMEDEIKHSEERFKSGSCTSFAQWVHCTLFRNGRNIPGSAFSGVDGYRVKKYVRSNENAFEKWFEASMTIIEIFQTQAMKAMHRGDDQLFWKIQRIARDVAASWSLTFTNKKAAKAIQLGSTKQVDDAAKERAKWIISHMKHIIPQFDDNALDNQALQGQTNMLTALIELRMEEFGIDVGDFMQLLGLTGRNRIMYDNMAIPFAEATIKKGKFISNTESKEILRQHATSGKKRVRKTAHTTGGASQATTGTKTGGKKKGKNKGRKSKGSK